MIILNALYFHDDWKYKFNKNKTSLKPFYLSNNQKETKVILMYNFYKNFDYYQNEKFQAIKLLYNTSKISAIIVLPS